MANCNCFSCSNAFPGTIRIHFRVSVSCNSFGTTLNKLIRLNRNQKYYKYGMTFVVKLAILSCQTLHLDFQTETEQKYLVYLLNMLSGLLLLH